MTNLNDIQDKDTYLTTRYKSKELFLKSELCAVV